MMVHVILSYPPLDFEYKLVDAKRVCPGTTRSEYDLLPRAQLLLERKKKFQKSN